MFRSKRSTLVKRLWKNRVPHDEAGSAISTESTEEELETKSVAHSMLKRLKERQLETLIASVETRGGEKTGCVLLPKGDLRLGKRSVAPHILCCKLWRWPALCGMDQLKRLPHCSSYDEPAHMCCNPYHYGVLVETDLPKWEGKELRSGSLIPYCGMDMTENDYDVVSMETGNTPSNRKMGKTEDSLTCGSTAPHWCTIAYWELQQRVGRLFTVHEDFIAIFHHLPHGNGLSLGAIQSPRQPEPVLRTREKIGLGIILWREGTQVWLYNRSLYPVFVNSSLFDLGCPSRSSTVIKVPPGRTLCVYDCVAIETYQPANGSRDFLEGPYDPRSLRISFAKGWGPNYHRQFITSCPCWLEVLLSVDS